MLFRSFPITPLYAFFYCHTDYFYFIRLLNWPHILNGQLKELSEDVGLEKSVREAAVKTAKDRIKAIDAAEEKAKVLAEKRSAKFEVKQNEANLKLAEVVSLNTA